MKKLLNRIFAWLIKQGADKWLHVIAGMVIAQFAMLLPITLIAKCIASFIGVTMIELCKENLIDSQMDWADVAFTLVGCVLGIGLVLLNVIAL